MYDVDVAGHGAVPSLIDTDYTGRSVTDFQATPDADYESKYKQMKVIVFGHESEYTALQLNILQNTYGRPKPREK